MIPHISLIQVFTAADFKLSPHPTPNEPPFHIFFKFVPNFSRLSYSVSASDINPGSVFIYWKVRFSFFLSLTPAPPLSPLALPVVYILCDPPHRVYRAYVTVFFGLTIFFLFLKKNKSFSKILSSLIKQNHPGDAIFVWSDFIVLLPPPPHTQTPTKTKTYTAIHLHL